MCVIKEEKEKEKRETKQTDRRIVREGGVYSILEVVFVAR